MASAILYARVAYNCPDLGDPLEPFSPYHYGVPRWPWSWADHLAAGIIWKRWIEAPWTTHFTVDAEPFVNLCRRSS